MAERSQHPSILVESEPPPDAQGALSCPASPQDYGFYGFRDLPPAVCGAGIGGFLWFPDQARMYGYLPAGEPADGPPTIVGVNRALSGRYQLVWWGPFRGLLEGPSDFEQQLRSDFRTCELDEAESPRSSRPIQSDELKAFRTFVAEYGA